MKKKIIIASATVFFAVATMFNMNLLQTNNAGDVSLESIAVMAQAQEEYISSLIGPPKLECKCVDCPKSEEGCWSYAYGSAGNDGYNGSWQCEGAGRIEQNVIDRNPNACR
jgi:hypothetical protein